MKELKRRYGESACFRCGTRRDLTIDHVVPRSRGGADDIENYQILCWDCNQAKGARSRTTGPSGFDLRLTESRS